MHPNEYLIRELIDKKGVAFGVDGVRRLKDGEIESLPVGYSNRQFVEKDAALITNRIADKSAAPYPSDTILIIDCTLSLPYMPDEWDDLMTRVRGRLPKTTFREIYLYDRL